MVRESDKEFVPSKIAKPSQNGTRARSPVVGWVVFVNWQLAANHNPNMLPSLSFGRIRERETYGGGRKKTRYKENKGDQYWATSCQVNDVPEFFFLLLCLWADHVLYGMAERQIAVAARRRYHRPKYTTFADISGCKPPANYGPGAIPIIQSTTTRR